MAQRASISTEDVLSDLTQDETVHVSCEVCGDGFIPNGRRKARCAKVHERTCVHCGEVFILKAADKLTKEFCSKKCSNGARSRVSICPVCGSEFTKRSKTCSTACATKLRNETVASQEKICEWCNESFSALSTKRFCERDHYSSCEVCGESFVIDPYLPRRTCSNLCNGKLVNTPESNELRRQTSLKNWGTEFPQQSEAVRKKIEESLFKRHGVKSPLSAGELRDKGRATSLEKYGNEWYSQSDEGKARREATNIERYGVPNVFMDPEINARARESFSKKLKDGSIKHRRVSEINRGFAKSLKDSLEIESIFEAPLGGFSVDMELTLPRGNTLLLDIHPTISHNSFKSFQCIVRSCNDDCEKHKPVETTYHFKRAMAALEEDRTLIQWYGWESEDKLVGFLRSRTLEARRVSARKLESRKITSVESNDFLKLYHVQGAGRGQSHCYGLYDEGNLVAVATFGRARFGAKASWEFLRYAVADGYVIHGASGRLFDMFKSETNPDSVVSYIDFSHTTRKNLFLNSMGFVEGKPTGPSVIWHRVRDNKVVKQTSLLRVGADRLLGTNYGSREESGLDNKGIMLIEGFLPVHTAGNRVFFWANEDDGSA